MCIKNDRIWIDPASSYNIFRALVVNPFYSKEEVTSLFIRYFADMQTESGDWCENLPFFHLLNALAHLNYPLADKQFEKALIKLFKTQKNDGTWNGTEPEWNTFLAVHALKNKGLF
jgi:hypothetical protein